MNDQKSHMRSMEHLCPFDHLSSPVTGDARMKIEPNGWEGDIDEALAIV
jgi:hypothetical protein